ncbi:hypothetical protein RFI_02051 [Reticulomyxa filosa]|uniref:Uncharacterized protein n=1 Tax=Reticulomyxa filosa TaxID=46433 RepID=X6PAD3_RETFI|nr:hypothetical protein RFI_02051 [Reticulomyxa filosa]|eukprot:ETO35019.1 hypothetical protein RFI_02051 [Reticulomyxa filosa]
MLFFWLSEIFFNFFKDKNKPQQFFYMPHKNFQAIFDVTNITFYCGIKNMPFMTKIRQKKVKFWKFVALKNFQKKILCCFRMGATPDYSSSEDEEENTNECARIEQDRQESHNKSEGDSGRKKKKRPLSELGSGNEEEDQAHPKAKRMKLEEVSDNKVEKNDAPTIKESSEPITKSLELSKENDNANKDTQESVNANESESEDKNESESDNERKIKKKGEKTIKDKAATRDSKKRGLGGIRPIIHFGKHCKGNVKKISEKLEHREWKAEMKSKEQRNQEIFEENVCSFFFFYLLYIYIHTIEMCCWLAWDHTRNAFRNITNIYGKNTFHKMVESKPSRALEKVTILKINWEKKCLTKKLSNFGGPESLFFFEIGFFVDKNYESQNK